MRMLSPAWAALCLALSGLPAEAAPACREPTDAPALSPPLGSVVVGKGRLQFYSTPESHCPMAGVFVIPKDQLVAYAQTDDGWTSVTYSHKAGDTSPDGCARTG
jgi:hypothetical protein